MEAVIEKTQKELGAVIQAPKLTEKLLSRPPFRFLHDVVMGVMKATGFPDGLYSGDQLDSAKVADKKAKVEFLEQLIAAVEAGTGASVAARPAKIVAGEEPEKTNELLQQLAKCATLSPTKKAAAVQKAKGGGAAAAPSPTAAAAAAAPSKKKEAKPAADAVPAAAPAAAETEEERAKRKEEERRRRHEEKKREAEKAKEKEKAAAAAAAAAAPAGEAAAAGTADTERHRHREEKKRVTSASAAAASTAADSPESAAATAAANTTTSARRAPPRPKPTHEVIEAQNAAGATPAVDVIREGKRGKADADSDEDEKADWQRVAEQYEAKPAARTAAVAEDADVKGLLGQQALKAKRDQEAAARRAEEGGAAAGTAAAGASSGGIIIRSSKNTASRGGGGHALGDSDLNQLREKLQLLTKASNPLGKFLEAIHDDIDSMTRELEMWRSESRNQALAAAEARRQTEESLQEIHASLQNLEDAISDQMLKTNNLRQSIFANDAAMDAMMKTIVNPDIAAQ